MQLLTTSTTSARARPIPGNVVALDSNSCHIGWNQSHLVANDSICSASNHDSFYFNHSFGLIDSSRHIVATTTFNNQQVASIIRKDNIVGIQFHPEKSQQAGKNLLKSIITKLTHA